MNMKLTLLALTGCACATVSFAQDVTLKLGVVTPTDHPHSISAREFARLVSEKTDGSVAVTVSDNGALGTNNELLDAVQSGIIDFTISTPGVMATYQPAMGLLELPYIFADNAHMLAVTRGETGTQIAESYKDDTGIEILSYFGGAQRNMITTKTAINSIDDLSGLKMRSPDVAVQLEWWDTLGSLGSVVAFAEVYTALQTGVVDGAENEFTTFTSARWAEVAKYVALTQHAITVRPLITNAAKMASLTAYQQRAIHEAAQEAADFDVALEGKLDEKNQASLAADFGVEFTTPDKAPMIAASADIIDKFAAENSVEDMATAISSAAN